MKAKYIFSLIATVVLCVNKMNAQIMPAVQKVKLSEQNKSVLDKHLSDYTAFTVDKSEIINKFYSNGSCLFQIYIDEQQNWLFDLKLNDMRAPDYKQTYIADEGKFEYEAYRVNTFKGTTSDNKIARFTIDDNNFFGVILDSHIIM